MNIHKHALTYAAAALVAAVLISITVYLAGLPDWVNYITYITLITTIVLGLRDWREKRFGGYMSYGKAMGYSTMLALYYCLMIAVWTYVFFAFIGPDALDKIKEANLRESIERMQKMNIPQEQIDMSVKISSSFMSPGMMAVFALFGGMLIITILNLIISIFLKKDAPPSQPDGNQTPPPYTTAG
ncbi:MAG TPA: DUF4199 domain-containing protein [Bacteroidia bacterium]|nr:DUF4199 domain-containing protein [Bacteroidia bacterium]